MEPCPALGQVDVGRAAGAIIQTEAHAYDRPLSLPWMPMRLLSPIYWSPSLYRMVMRLLYRGRYHERYALVANLVPPGASVVELCCGCGYLYEAFLAARGVEYLGIDLLPQMVTRLLRLGARVQVGDLLEMDVPAADFCLMLGSLYHFHPREGRVLELMARSNEAVLLEPVENLTESGSTFLKAGGILMSYIGRTSSTYRLDNAQLDALLASPGLEILSDQKVLVGKYRLVRFRRAAEGSPA